MRSQRQEICLCLVGRHYKIWGCDALENRYFVSFTIHAATTCQQWIPSSYTSLGIMRALLCVVQWSLVKSSWSLTKRHIKNKASSIWCQQRVRAYVAAGRTVECWRKPADERWAEMLFAHFTSRETIENDENVNIVSLSWVNMLTYLLFIDFNCEPPVIHPSR